MRIRRDIAWLIVLLAFGTAALLRRFHEHTPASPFVPAIVGSLLFAAIFLLLLVTARETALGAVGGRGVRLGSLTPLLLMLLVEKWVSITLYGPAFHLLAPRGMAPAELDALFRLLAGLGLLGTVALTARFSAPARREVARRCRPGRFPPALLATVLALGGTYAILAGLGLAMGWTGRMIWPPVDRLFLLVAGGQFLRSFAEETYYRGVLLSEVSRLAPRLGLSGAARRWTALLLTSLLFGFEHLELGPPWSVELRQLVFTISLGVLFGMLVLVTDNLHLAAGIHAAINAVLLGAVPRLADPWGQPLLPSGTYVGVLLILAFTLAFAAQSRARRSSPPAPPGAPAARP